MPDPSTPTNDESLGTGWAREVRTRLSSLRLSPTREAEIVEELSQHLDDRWRELMAGGASPDEATRLTLSEFRDGDVLARYMAPLRQAHQPPSITPGAPAGTLCSAISGRTCATHCATMAAQARLHRRRHPVVGPRHRRQYRDIQPVERRAARLAACRARTRATGDALESGRLGDVDRPVGRPCGPGSRYGEFEQLRDHAEGFSALMASQSSLSTWQVRFEGGAWEEASGRLVSGGFFQVLGVGPAIGRVFTTADDRAETPSAVIS